MEAINNENNNLLPGDEGYVAPVVDETNPPVQDPAVIDPPVATPPVPDAPAIVNTEDVGLEEPAVEVVPETVSKEAYDKLQTVFEYLLIRENVDIQLQRQYRLDAGLI